MKLTTIAVASVLAIGFSMALAAEAGGASHGGAAAGAVGSSDAGSTVSSS
jgi:hypothetical protein